MHPLLTLLLDRCLYAPLASWRDEFVHVRACVAADWRQLRKTGVFRRKPEKGFNRVAMAIGWLVLHTFALVVLTPFVSSTVLPTLHRKSHSEHHLSSP